MRSAEEVAHVRDLLDAGLNYSQVSRRTGISRAAIRSWVNAGLAELLDQRTGHTGAGTCDGTCQTPQRASSAPAAYAYLLGQYLGDGTIRAFPRGVYHLRIFCCSHYPRIVDRVVASIDAVFPNLASRYPYATCAVVVVSVYWKHVPCLFPQHGPGMKHTRRIVLADWQDEIVCAFPQEFLRGLIESDGCRVINRVNGGEYPRYMFSNASDDIRALCTRTLEQLGVHWTTANARNIAVSRRADVEYLDRFIGPKQ